MILPLWWTYFFKEVTKVFFFFLLSFFFLYSLLDYATHMEDFFHNNTLQIKDILLFYGCHFLKRADLLLPLALMVATIKTLTTFNVRREWMALQVAGLPRKKLIRPFLVLALLCSLFNWISFQSLLPYALNQMDEFRMSHFKGSHRAKQRELIHLLSLKDRSKLLYQTYDTEKKELFDVLWIRSQDDIWRMKFLDGDPTHPEGRYVDHLVRNKEGFLEKKDSFDRFYFLELKWNPKMLGQSQIPFENRSFKELFRLAIHSALVTPYEIPKITTQICFKLAIPLLSPLALLSIIPLCVHFSRRFNPFFIYAIGIFGTLSFYMLIDALTILGEQATLSPIIGIFTPFLISAILIKFFRKTASP